MAPADLLMPLEGQREQTFMVLESLGEGDLETETRSHARTVRQVLAHVASSELEAIDLIRRALAGEVVHSSPEDREQMMEDELAREVDWDLDRIRAELTTARQELRSLFTGMDEEDLDRQIRWPDWPARTIRTSIPYMLEHEDSHLDEVRSALQLGRSH